MFFYGKQEKLFKQKLSYIANRKLRNYKNVKMGKAVYNEFVMCSFGVKLTIQIQKQPPEVCYKKGVLKIFCKIHGKALVPEFLFY